MKRCLAATLFASFASTSICLAQFDRVYNFPPEDTFVLRDSNVQVNFYAGGRAGEFYLNDSELNLFGGELDLAQVNNGTVNAHVGGVQLFGGNTDFHLFGGIHTYAPGDLSESRLTLYGSEFYIDNVFVESLAELGDRLEQDVRARTLNGLLSDGTPINFYFAPNQFETVTLVRSEIPPIERQSFEVPGDTVDSLRGQSILVVEDGELPQLFQAASGSEVIIRGGHAHEVRLHRSFFGLDGGRVNTLLVRDGEVDVTDGSIRRLTASFGADLRVHGGSVHAIHQSNTNLRVNGGEIEHLFASAGSISVHGGHVAFTSINNTSTLLEGGLARIKSLTGELSLIGDSFQTDGNSLEGLIEVGDKRTISIAPDSVVYARLTDGTPFVWRNSGESAVDLHLSVANTEPQLIPPIVTSETIQIPYGIQGQDVTVSANGRIGDHFHVGRDSSVTLETGSRLGAETVVYGGTLNINGGDVGRDLHVFEGGRVNLRSGTLGTSAIIESGSELHVTGGSTLEVIVNDGSVTVGQNATDDPSLWILRLKQSVATQNGGRISIVEISDAVMDVHDGELGRTYLNTSGLLRVHGGETSQLDLKDSVVELHGGLHYGPVRQRSGDVMILGGILKTPLMFDRQSHWVGGEFQLNQKPVLFDDLTTLDLPQRSILTGTLADGTPFMSEVLGRVTLEKSPLDDVPQGLLEDIPMTNVLRSGQTLRIGTDDRVPKHFRAGPGSEVIVDSGATIEDGFDAIDANITINGGNIEHFTAFRSQVLVNADTFHGSLVASHKSSVTAVGTEISALRLTDSNGFLQNVRAGSVSLTGGSLTMEGGSIEQLSTVADSTLIEGGGDFEIRALRDAVVTGASIDHVHVDGGQFTTNSGLQLIDSEVGSIEAAGSVSLVGTVVSDYFDIRFGTAEVIRSHVHDELDVDTSNASVHLIDSHVERLVVDSAQQNSMYGGSVQSFARIDGRLIAFAEFKSHLLVDTIDFRGGSVGGEFRVSDFAKISGGNIGDQFFAEDDSQVHVYGTQFHVNGQPVDQLVSIGDRLRWDERVGTVDVELTDGTNVRFNLDCSLDENCIDPDARLYFHLARPRPACDLDGNDDCNIQDLDLLAAFAGSQSPQFDLDGDGIVDQSDFDRWRMEAQDELGFLLTASDINLDGQTDAEDLRIIGVNWQRRAVGWSQGDLNADGVVDAIDLNLVGIDWPTVMPKPVPETAPPLFVWLLGFALRVRSGFSRGTAICQSRE